MSKSEYKLKKIEGILRSDPLPSKEELKKFYSGEYYQQASIQYQHSYENEELLYFQNMASLVITALQTIKPHNPKNFKILDLGCGEGFDSKTFISQGYETFGADFSMEGLSRHNPNLFDTTHYKQGDIVSDFLYPYEKFDFVFAKSVLEHVLEPLVFLKRIKLYLKNNGIGCIVVPNDYSDLHINYLKGKPFENAPFFCPPQHLTYFNSKTIVSFIENCGFKILYSYSSYPVEQFLLHESTDFYNNKEFGKIAHKLRLRFINSICEQGHDNALSLLSAFFKVGMGRTSYVFFS